MNALKFQQDVLTAYMRSTTDTKRESSWVRKDDGHVVLFLNAHVGAFVRDEDLVLNPAKLNEVQGFAPVVQETLRYWVEGNLLTPTEEYRFQAGNKKIRIYKARAWQTGIDQSLLKYFDLAAVRLYQQKEYGIILITEKTKGFEEPVGIVLPVRL